jgi:adenylate kinase family enzyme
MNLPIFKTKIEGINGKFNLNDPDERREYFLAKAGPEIEKLRNYLKTNTFIAYLLGKKNSGKGTYSKLFMEVVGPEHISHLSIGDIVRDVHKAYESGKGKEELTAFLEKNFRGFHGLEEIENIILGRGTTTLISSELIVALIKYEISKRPKRAIFVDGFPRALDQVTYSLFLKELIGYRDDPDFFVFIDVPEAVIDERMKNRVICPKCQTPRSLKLAPTAYVGYDEAAKTAYLLCDNPECGKPKMVAKEGDELGIEKIRERLELDDKIMRQLLELKGVPQVLLRNSVPVGKAKEYVDDYEITPAYEYEYDSVSKKVKTIEKPWVVKDDDGVDSYSLLPAPVTLGLIIQTANVLGL